MTARRPLLVVNPRSGGGRTERTFPAMREAIEARLGPVEVARTAAPGHAIEIAADAARAGVRLIVAVGGDGTIHEVANGILQAGLTGREQPRLGIIGQGTGGDFRRSLGVEHRLDKYLDAITSGQERAVDVGWLKYRDVQGQERERYFVNVLSAGLGGLVDRYVADASRALGGTAAYYMASLKALARSKAARVTCKYRMHGDTVERDLHTYLVAICNGRYFGSSMMIGPAAELDDGAFDVVTIGGASKLELMLSSRKMYDGSHLKVKSVESFRCDAISLDLQDDAARDTFLLDVDGEPLGGLPLAVELRPKALVVRA